MGLQPCLHMRGRPAFMNSMVCLSMVVSLEISVQSAMLDTPYSLCLKLLIWLVCEISDLKFFPGL